MAQFDLQGLWETSLLGRFLLYLLVLWEGSFTYRVLSAIGQFCVRVFNGSALGRFWYSDWPAGLDYRRSTAGRVLDGLNDWAGRVGRRVAPFLRGTWESSLLVRAGNAVVELVGPYAAGSTFFQAFCGYAGDTALAPAESGKERPSPLVYLLGAVIGILSLIPSPEPGAAGSGGVLNPTRLMLVGVWGIALVWFLYKVMTGNFRWRASSAFLPLAVFMVIAAAATVQSAARGDSFQNFLLWLTAALLFFLMVNLVRNTRDAAAFLGPIMVGGVLMALWTVWQLKHPPVILEAWVDPSQGDLTRPFAGMNNPNYLAEYMVLFIPPVIALWLQQPKRRLELAVPVLAMTFALLVTLSRGGWLALLLALVVFFILRAGRWSFLLVLGGGLGAILFPVVAPQTIKVRVYSAFSTTDTSNQYRLNVWVGVWHMIQKYWALGSGLGGVAFADVYQEFMLSGARAAHSHNTYLQMAAETGVTGFAAIMWTLAANARRLLTVGAQKLRSPMIAAVGGALVGLLFHALVEHIWYNPKLLFAFWALLGLGMGLVLGDREDAAA